MLPKMQNDDTIKTLRGAKSEPENQKAKEIIEAKETIETLEKPHSKQSTIFSNDMLHMLMSEVRLQNTEMRLSLMKIHEKLDKCNGDGSKANQSSDVDAQIKKTMNK